MDIVLLYCLLLFLVYLGIVGLLVYYFFYSRDIWNIILAEIHQDLEYITNGCARHNILGLFIPGFIYSRSSGSSSVSRGKYDNEYSECRECRECINEEHEQQYNIYNVKKLGNIYSLIKNIDANLLDGDKLDTNISEKLKLSSRWKMIQLILEYIIRNYQEIVNADYSLYTKLLAAYLAAYLADASSNSTSSKNVVNGIEIIPILEEYSNTFNTLEIICQDINIDFMPGTFIIGFYQDLKTLITDTRQYLSEFLGLKS